VATVDPEVVRGRVSRYFERASHRIEEHGGHHRGLRLRIASAGLNITIFDPGSRWTGR